MGLFRRYFISGLLVWVPIWVTLLIINFIVSLLDNTFSALPTHYQPDALFGFHVPGLGFVITILVIFITGVIAANFLGSRVVSLWDGLIGRIPLVRSVYAGVKQMLETVFSTDGHSFRKVLLVEYPRKGLWSIAFQTGSGCKEVQTLLDGEELVTLFIPTTPNPTSGFLMMAKKNEVVELNMPIDQALKFVISLGVVQPGAAKQADVRKMEQS
jgi:uncharacterized membrane protein